MFEFKQMYVSEQPAEPEAMPDGKPEGSPEGQPEERPSSFAQIPISRRLAREIALRAAYAIEMRGCTPEEALKDPLVTDGSPPPSFALRLVALMDGERDKLDDVIRAKIERWEFHRVAVIDKLILRLGASELLYFPDVPPKVSINEAIEIAKKFSTENSGRFINGVLDAIYGDMGRGEKIPTEDGGFRIEV
jgi:transcription antitermination factor NusB